VGLSENAETDPKTHNCRKIKTHFQKEPSQQLGRKLMPKTDAQTGANNWDANWCQRLGRN